METVRAKMARPGTAVTLTLLILAAAFGLAGLVVWQGYRAALVTGETKALSSADIVAAHLQWMMEASDQALRRIDAAIGDGPTNVAASAVADITKAVGDLPAGFQYSVYDPDGVLRLSSFSSAVGIRIDDRGYFEDAKAGQQTVVSPRLIERLSGEPVFIVGRRIVRDGRFHGLATIAIPRMKMDDFWTALGFGPLSTVSIIRTDGWIVARHPDTSEATNIKGTQLFDALAKAPRGTYHNKHSPVDGYSRIIGYHKIDDWPLIAVAGIEQNEALDLFWQSFRLQLAFGLPLLVLLVGFAIWIAWLLRAYAVRNLALEQAIEKNHFLFREIHHRVKNNLQAVSSLVRLQPLPEEVRADLGRRIAAMVAVHEHIYQSDQFDRVELVPYIERLIRQIAGSYSYPVALDLHLEPVTVDRDTVLPVGMIVNEVVSNAFKYAFADREDGRLSVDLKVVDDEASLTIRDNGPGIPGEVRRGMGSKLITGFVGQIGGRYEVTNQDGVVFELHFRTVAA